MPIAPRPEPRPKLGATASRAIRDDAVIPADSGQPAVIYHKSRVFRIAFNVEPADVSKIREVRLTRSSDLGGTWEAVDRTTPDRPSFSFRAPRDGEFWFAFQTIDQKDRPNPPSDAPIEPRLKVIVDTEAPTLLADPRDRRTSRATVSWEAHDEHLDLRTLRLEQQRPDGSWRTVPIDRSQASGIQVWNAETEQGFRSAMTVADLAGNVRRIEFDVPPSPNASPPSASAPSPNPVESAEPESATTPPAAETAEPNSESSSLPDPDEAPVSSPPAPEAPPASERPSRTLVSDRAERSEPRPQPRSEPEPESRPEAEKSEAADSGTATRAESASRILNDPFGPGAMATAANPFRAEARPSASASTAGADHAIIGKPPSGPGGRAAIPTILVAGPRFPLQYEVENAGPDGPATVELWVTRDGGRTWGRLPEDPDRVSPYLVDVGGEGIFGLTLVTRSASGAGDLPPAPSSAPEMWVEVDAAPPQIQLEPPSVGVGEHAGKVAITWRVNDAHLGSPCILLRYRPEDQPNAPWKRIAEPLDNTGKFIWKVPQDVPPRFHIRIDAIDTLKNRSYADTLTSGPVVLERSKPKGRIIGLDPDFRAGSVVR